MTICFLSSCIKDIQNRLLTPLKKPWLSLIGSVLKRKTIIEYCAFFIAILYYAFAPYFPSRNPFYTIIPISNITHLKAICISNPVKSGDYYIISGECIETVKKDTGSSFSAHAQGTITLCIPQEILEAMYPGKLYSASLSHTIFEKGSIIFCSVHISQKNSKEPFFFLEQVQQQGFSSTFSYFRALLRLQFKRLMYSWSNAGALLLALLSGSREYIDKTVADGFKNAGLSHILALSGMHLSFFGGIAATTSKKIAGRKFSSFFSCIALLLFVWFAGFSPSLLRAFICSMIVFYCSFFHLKPTILRVLCLCFVIQICISPQDGTCISFLLSYSALFGIATFGKCLQGKISVFIPPKIASALCASVGAQLCTIPITIIVFGTLTPIGIIASVVVSPLVSLFMIGGLLCILLSLCIPSLIIPLGTLMGGLYEIIRFLVLLFSQIPPIRI